MSAPTAPDLDAIAAAIGEGAVARPGSDAYEAATQPRNTRPETVLIDTRGLDSISVDAADRRATVGGGTQWGPCRTPRSAAACLG